MLGWWATAGWACGGFFCDGGYATSTSTGEYSVPVQQNGERILFEVNPDDTVTTFVEVGFEQTADVDFGWVIPIPAAIDADSVGTASADLLNALDLATAPGFTFHWLNRSGYGGYGGYGSGGEGCRCGGCYEVAYSRSTGGGSTTFATTATVVVQDQAVVGPFDIQVITAEDGAGFAEWLATNGYQLPDNAVAPLQHYIDLHMAFLGVKLSPDVSAGPIDTLQFTYPSTMPMIPLILTAIASVDDLPIEAWILADDPYIPSGWGIARDVAPDVLPDGVGGTDYLDDVADEIDRYDGKAMELEYSGPTSMVPGDGGPADALLAERRWLTRWRGDISPSQMTVDPEFVPEAGLGVYANGHDIQLGFAQGSTPTRRGGSGSAWLALPLGLMGWWQRRTRTDRPV